MRISDLKYCQYTRDVYLLVESGNGNKNLKIKCKIYSVFFYLYQLFGCKKVNFGPLKEKQPQSPDVNYNGFLISI